MTQDEALAILKTGASVFLTGEPGSGKTHTINRYVRWLREHDIEPAITASTGIAATHINGRTIHSWSGIKIRETLTANDLAYIASNDRIAQRVTDTKILIIDEISMLSANTLSMVEAVCRNIRENSMPFGGLQVILIGDFFQLPPIVRRTPDERSQQHLVPQKERSQFAFGSPAWEALHPTVCYLSEQHRQEDPIFLEMLSAIRRGLVDANHHALLKQRSSALATDGVTQLFSHNIDVDHMNERELNKLQAETRTYTMSSRGPTELVAQLKKGCLSPEVLSLKVGARVMFTKNDLSFRYVNGTLGTISGFTKEKNLPIVKTQGGNTIMVEPVEWTIDEGDKILARISQTPLRLAWAMTVHKSQGLSLDSAHMDLRQVFEYGQGYVALSRVRTLAGLTLIGFNERALQVHPEIMIKDEEFREASLATTKKLAITSAKELAEKQNNFILRCGGKIKAGRGHKEKKARRSTFETTRDLVTKKLSIEDMAEARSLTADTIVGHLEKLIAQGLINSELDLSYLKPRTPRFKVIENAFEKSFKKTGALRLSPVREILGPDFTFDELRLARLFLLTPEQVEAPQATIEI